MKNTAYYGTTIGQVGISESDGAITELFIVKEHGVEEPAGKETPVLKAAVKQLEEYLAGKRKVFDLKLAPVGTEFQKKVWEALRDIPYGQTRSYKQIAEVIGQPKACRAIGMANNKNPMMILTPCHRVIGANGKLVGYAGGLDVKEKLLALEKAHV